MALTVKDSIQLTHLKAFRQVSGPGGLNKNIEKVAFLDHETIEGVKGKFYKGDFVVTTFTAIRNNTPAIEACIKDLIACEVSALAIKTIFVNHLSKTMIDYANTYDFPIFLFDQNTYYEDIMEDLIGAMQSRTHFELLESKIDLLYTGTLKAEGILKLAKEININIKETHQLFYLKEKVHLSDEKNIKTVERYLRSRHQNKHHSLIKYRDGLLIILSGSEKEMVHTDLTLNNMMNLMGLKSEDYRIGISQKYSSLTQISQAVKECIYAEKICDIDSLNQLEYARLGTYKLLFSSDEAWMKHYVTETLTPLYEYDSGKFMETLKVYIACKGDLIKTSKTLFLHKNTIRYRLNKLKERLKISEEYDFYETVSTALKCEKLLQYQKTHI